MQSLSARRLGPSPGAVPPMGFSPLNWVRSVVFLRSDLGALGCGSGSVGSRLTWWVRSNCFSGSIRVVFSGEGWSTAVSMLMGFLEFVLLELNHKRIEKES